MWGYLANVQVPLPKRKKLGPKTIECTFLGYANNSTTCKFLVVKSSMADVQANAIIELMDAEFFENIFSYKKKTQIRKEVMNKFTMNMRVV